MRRDRSILPIRILLISRRRISLSVALTGSIWMPAISNSPKTWDEEVYVWGMSSGRGRILGYGQRWTAE
jgi:hypothetical protein